MGPTLEETRRDLRYMPTQYLTQVAQSPADRVIGDIPLKTLAGLELSRRAQMQTELAAMNAANPQMPTVLGATIQSLSPQPQQPMPQQGMMPPQQPQQPMPQQGMPQPQPQQPQQPQQQQPQQPQQQPPQAKQPPIMGLPAMQAPKKMAGGGIIAFAGGDSVPPAEEEATSPLGDMLRSFLRGPEKDGKNAREIEWEAAKANPNTWFNLTTAMTPSQRAAASEKAAGLRREAESIRGTSVPPAVNEDAKKKEGKPEIINAPDPTSGIAAIMQAMGGGRGGGGGPSREDSALRKQLLADIDKVGPAQTEYTQNASRLANQLENFKSSSLSGPERDAFIKKEFEQNQAYSKPHFDMMQKLIDEERASNQAGKENEIYKVLGKMGSTLMSSRGAFGPALGRAVGEGIDYNDKLDAARAAADRLRRQSQMDLLKARMLDEKGDRQSALAALADSERNRQAADKLQIDTQVAAMNIRGKSAELEAGDQRGRERVLNALAVSDANNAARAAIAGANQQNAMLKMQMGLMGLQDKNRPTTTERIALDKRAEEVFSNPNNPAINKFIALTPGGKNILNAIQMGTKKPNDPQYLEALQSAQELYKKYLSQGTRTGGSGVQSGADYLSSIGG
jgi:hypothetical protein